MVGPVTQLGTDPNNSVSIPQAVVNPVFGRLVPCGAQDREPCVFCIATTVSVKGMTSSSLAGSDQLGITNTGRASSIPTCCRPASLSQGSRSYTSSTRRVCRGPALPAARYNDSYCSD